MKSLIRIFTVLLLGLAVPSATLTACSKSSAQATRYHCPMHPTYISDKPGDCPICGMRLVPIDEKGGATAASSSMSSSAASSHVHPSSSNQSTEHTVWTCPMHPEVVSDQAGRCPKCGMPLEPKDSKDVDKAAVDTLAARRILYYRSPMDPKVTSPTPTKDSMGMDFVPVYSDEAPRHAGVVPGLAPIDISAEGLRLAGVRTAVAENGRIARTIRAVGVVRPDETRIRHVHTKISGWIEKLYVNFTGEAVAAGRPILTIYSQELLAAQHEYIQAKSASKSLQASDLSLVREGAGDMMAASRRRLELLDVPKSLIEKLDQGGPVSRTVTLAAPVGGVVMSKNVFEGQQVEPGMELFTVTDLSRVWIEADVYESEASAVHVGQEGRITFINDPGQPLVGKIKYIYPYLNAETRTLRVRFAFPNPQTKFKLESYANVEIPVETDEGAIVPDSAIMDTGVRQVAFVNTAEGRFEPRQVQVGIRAEGKAQILSGVVAGERVAVKANFLLDSESRLRAALLPEAMGGAVPPPPSPSASAHSGSHP